MTDELETLKDIVKKRNDNSDFDKNWKKLNFNVSEFRAIAIEWVKQMNEIKGVKANHDGFCLKCKKHTSYTKAFGPVCKHEEKIMNGCYECSGETEGATRWIKHFFNLSEEDLK